MDCFGAIVAMERSTGYRHSQVRPVLSTELATERSTGHGDQIISGDLVGPPPYTVQNVIFFKCKTFHLLSSCANPKIMGIVATATRRLLLPPFFSIYTYSTAADTVLQPEVPAAT